jgi:hypothetical protein
VKRALFVIKTWDTDADEFTPQRGVRCGPYTLFGLRKAVRKLRRLGYPCCKDDPAVSISCVRDGMTFVGRTSEDCGK